MPIQMTSLITAHEITHNTLADKLLQKRRGRRWIFDGSDVYDHIVTSVPLLTTCDVRMIDVPCLLKVVNDC